ncbi:homeobox protein 2-like [Aphidius gifuensis]|uniref:homeobox protein 2-like n=1 Tax=Aphidius gifuensis TaxID=684658 RepID=UPI001CDC2499|nr:homeobox protein 2-like [Aphidius gifuensis]
MSKSEKDNKDDDHQNENNQDDNKYYNKVRASMKKDPASVQYWIDTGEPPHKLDVIEQPDSASSISEDDDDDDDCGDNLKFDKSSLKHDNNNKTRGTSPVDSSVDTAAYILSNKNITKKAEAIAIIEDSKTPKKLKSNSENNNTNNEVKLSIESSILCNGNEEIVDDQNDINKSLDKSTNKTKEINYVPLKISDAVMHLDKILNATKKSTSQDDDSTEDLQFKNNNETSNKAMKSYQRRKLYTGRSSPVDICSSSAERRPRSLAITANETLVNQTPSTGIKKRKRFRKTIKITKQRRSSRLASINENCSTEKNDFIKRLESSYVDDKKKLLLNYQKEAKLKNKKLQIHNSQVKIFTAKSNSQSKDDDKLKNLKDLCSKKQLVVCLNKIPDNIFNSLITKTTIESDERLINSQHNKKPKLPIKPLLPNHSKIVDKKIIHKTSNKSKKYEDSKNKHMKRKRRNFKAKNVEIKKYNSDDVLVDIKNLFNDVSKNNDLTLNNMRKNLNNPKCLYSFCIDGSSDDESEIIPPVTRRTIFNKETITFSSDEEDDFDKLLQENKKKKRRIS